MESDKYVEKFNFSKVSSDKVKGDEFVKSANEFIAKLNTYINNIDVSERKYTIGSYTESHNENTAIPYKVYYPELFGKMNNYDVHITFLNALNLYEVKDQTMFGSGRMKTSYVPYKYQLADYFNPNLNISIKHDFKNPFSIKKGFGDLLRLVLLKLKMKKNYIFSDKALDKMYYIEPKYYSETLKHVGELISEDIKSLPTFNSLYFYDQVMLSLPFHTVDFGDKLFIKNILNVLYNIIGKLNSINKS